MYGTYCYNFLISTKFSYLMMISGAGAVIHTHSKHAVLATLMYTGREFRIKYQEMIKGIRNDKTGRLLMAFLCYENSIFDARAAFQFRSSLHWPYQVVVVIFQTC